MSDTRNTEQRPKTIRHPNRTWPDGTIAQGTLGFVISRVAESGIHEDLDITNYSLMPVRFNLEIALGSDFADIFEVKAHKLVRRGHIVTRWDEDQSELRTAYTNCDFHRCFTYRVCNYKSVPNYANGRINFEVVLEAGANWHACCYYILEELGNASVDLRFWREAKRTRWDASVQAGDINVQQLPWQPWLQVEQV